MPGLSVIAPTKVAVRGRAARSKVALRGARGWATIWRPSLVVFAHAMAPQRRAARKWPSEGPSRGWATYIKFMAANLYMSLFCAMANGLSSSTLMKPLSKSCVAFKHLINQILIQPMHAFLRLNSVFMCYIALHPVRVFVIIRVFASNSWSCNGAMPLADFRKNCLVGGILRLLLSFV